MAASKPTSPLSVETDLLYPLTLSQDLGTLTLVWVVPLTDTKLTPVPRLLPSTTIVHSEFNKEAESLDP